MWSVAGNMVNLGARRGTQGQERDHTADCGGNALAAGYDRDWLLFGDETDR